MRPLLLAVLVCVVVSGCSGGSNKAPATATVSGTVLLDNQPMAGGEVRFSVSGEPTQIVEVKDGSFSGPVYIGKNHVEVVWEKDGAPNPTDPKAAAMRVNVVSDKFSGPTSPLTADVDASGKSGLKFEVKSAARK
jgi:hypothetical protein